MSSSQTKDSAPGTASPGKEAASSKLNLLEYKDLTVHRQQLLAAYNADIMDTIKQVIKYDDRYLHGPTFPPDARIRLLADMSCILAASPQSLVKYHIRGDFDSKMFTDDDEAKAFQKHVRAMEQYYMKEDNPIIFRVSVVRKYGRTHRKAAVLQALNQLQAYVDDDPQAILIIDGASGLKGSWFREYEGARKTQVRAFIANTIKRLGPAAANARVAPFFHTGATLRGKQLRQHLASSSNYIMHMFKAAININQPEDDPFQLVLYPLWLCTQPTHVEAGQILFERLGEGMVAFGAGFGHQIVEVDANADKIPERVWARHLKFVHAQNNMEDCHTALDTSEAGRFAKRSEKIIWDMEGLMNETEDLQRDQFERLYQRRGR